VQGLLRQKIAWDQLQAAQEKGDPDRALWWKWEYLFA
jgi:hypothetical protein